jgi:hypothetical protein
MLKEWASIDVPKAEVVQMVHSICLTLHLTPIQRFSREGLAVGSMRRRRLSERERGLAIAVSGAVAGALSRTLTAPFDRIRIVAAGTGVSVSSAVRVIRKEGSL